MHGTHPSPLGPRPFYLLIRADAGEGIGAGHVMRQLALAQAVQSVGGRATLLSHCPSPRLVEHVRAAGITFEPLADRHPDPADLSATLALLKRGKGRGDRCKAPGTRDHGRGLASGPSRSSSLIPHPSPSRWIVLDGYHFDTAYQEAIRLHQTDCRLLVIDDPAHLPRYHADLLVNQNLPATELDYVCDEHTTLMLGPRYALVRPEFRKHAPRARVAAEVSRKVLVTLGGEDPENVTLLALRAVDELDLPGLECRVVVGPANPHLETLRRHVQRSSANLRLLTNVTDMPGLMAWADVALSAAGITCWELALMQLPAVVLVLAENQQSIAEPLAERGVVVNLGRPEKLTAETIAGELEALCRDRRRRVRQSEAGRKLLDGRGAERVVAVMRALDEPIPEDQLTLRSIAAEDMLPIWRLANAPSVRGNSLSSEPIPLDTHAAWFAQKLSSPDTRMWALDFHGLLLGQIRYDRVEAGAAEISISVAAAFRRRGLGSKLLEQTRNSAADHLGVSRFRAVVRRENQPSVRTFLKAGFHRVTSKDIRGQACEVFERNSS